MSKETGVWRLADGSIRVVWESKETRDGTRGKILPPGLVKELDGFYESPFSPFKKSRKDAALAVINERPGMKFGSVISETAERHGEDSEDSEIRRQIGGMLNQMAEREIIYRDLEEDTFWPSSQHFISASK